MERWAAELEKIDGFMKLLEETSSVPTLSDDELTRYSERVIYIQDLLALIASMPPSKRPDIAEWDDVVSKLWRKLFAKGDDIDRYTFSDLWLKVLADTKDDRRILRTATAFIASCRNFSLYDEALEIGALMTERFGDSNLAAFANFTNSLASVYYCKRDYEKAEKHFLRAREAGQRIHEEEIRIWIGASKTDFLGQETLNIVETYLDRAQASDGLAREEWLLKSEALIKELDAMALSENLKTFLLVTKSEYSMLRGAFGETQFFLDRIDEAGRHGSGPYYYSIATTHARLKARYYGVVGEWTKAYQWIRRALRLVSTKTYPAEDIFVLEDAIKIVRKLYDDRKGNKDTELVKDLVLLLEDKDWYTGGSHSRQVAELCLRIGHILKREGHTTLNLLDLEMAGLVHDIGKLKIPWSLLNKVAPITPKERGILQLHAQFGKEILEEIGLDESAQVVYEHHETIDGKGYPLGKRPGLEASIVGISDVFDASTTLNRRYKVAKSISEAVAEIVALADIKYDAEAVKGMKKLVDSMA